MPSIRVMHLRRNKIDKLEEEAPPLESLVKLNMRSNSIKNFDILERLLKNEKLVDLNILNNPLETTTSSFNMLMSEVLSKNSKLQRFCKVSTKEQHLLEAVHFRQFKWGKSEEERKRRAAEEAAKEVKDE
jgi:hypothetical protein